MLLCMEVARVRHRGTGMGKSVCGAVSCGRRSRGGGEGVGMALRWRWGWFCDAFLIRLVKARTGCVKYRSDDHGRPAGNLTSLLSA